MFCIKASIGGDPIAQTRGQAASALALAMRWVSAGLDDVRIERDGKTYDVAAFRKRFSVTRAGLSRQGLSQP